MKLLNFDDLLKKCPSNLKARIIALKDVEQRVDHHPEGNVFNHTKIVVNRLIKYHNPTLTWAGMFHDIGKDVTTFPNEKGILQAIGHEKVSADLVEEYYDFLSHYVIHPREVKEIVSLHMRIKLFEEMSPKKQKQMVELDTFGELMIFRICDSMKTLTQQELNSVL